MPFFPDNSALSPENSRKSTDSKWLGRERLKSYSV